MRALGEIEIRRSFWGEWFANASPDYRRLTHFHQRRGCRTETEAWCAAWSMIEVLCGRTR
jgi:hypothetical protein